MRIIFIHFTLVFHNLSISSLLLWEKWNYQSTLNLEYVMVNIVPDWTTGVLHSFEIHHLPISVYCYELDSEQFT